MNTPVDANKNDKADANNEVPKVPSIYKKEFYESDGMTVVRRECVQGAFTDWVQPFMGLVTVGVQMPNGQTMPVQREFPIEKETVEECFFSFMETLTKRQKDIQKQIEAEMIAQHAAQPRIVPAGGNKRIDFNRK